MQKGLANLNDSGKHFCLARRNDDARAHRYNLLMATARHDWFLKEWLRATKKKQADLVRALDWNKAKASLTASGKQPYNRDDVNEAADYLNIAPYELLMHPDDAFALRRLRQDAIKIAADNTKTPLQSVDTPSGQRDGTNG